MVMRVAHIYSCKFIVNENISWYNVCLGSISIDFTKDEQIEFFLNGTADDFSVDHSLIKKEDILNIYQYAMVRNNIKKYLALPKKIVVKLLNSIVNASKYTKCVSLSNQKCTTQLTRISLYLNKYTQGLLYYPFVVNLDRYVGSSNSLNDLSNKVCVPRKTKNLNVSFFNMKKITGINEAKKITKRVSCK